jgi:hypothetical protein
MIFARPPQRHLTDRIQERGAAGMDTMLGAAASG